MVSVLNQSVGKCLRLPHHCNEDEQEGDDGFLDHCELFVNDLSYFFLNFLYAWKADKRVCLVAIGVVYGIGGNVAGLVQIEDVIVLLFREVVVVAGDVTNHVFPVLIRR